MQVPQSDVQLTLQSILGIATRLLDTPEARDLRQDGLRLRDLVERLIAIADLDESGDREAGQDGQSREALGGRTVTELASMGLTPRYELPTELLDRYHRLLDRKFDGGLAPDEEAELSQVSQQLDAAEAETSLYRETAAKERARYQRVKSVLDEVIEKLASLERAS